MKVQQAKNGMRKTANLVHVSKKPMPKDRVVNPYAPFEGVDGKTTFAISYPKELNNSTNCYSFALGIRAKGNPTRDFYPGFLSGFPLSLEFADNIEERVRADLTALGRKVHEIIYADNIPVHLPMAKNGTVWIKALKTPYKEEGIHFMIKNEASGRWIHKMGWYMPPKVVVRNLEVRSDFEMLLEMYPQYKRYFSQLGKEAEEIIQKLLESQNLYSLYRSRLEDEDNASYWSFPNNATELEEYVSLWVMRISE